MTDEELLVLFRLEESDRVERKESPAHPDRVRQAICAHANDLPNHRQRGVIFIGQRDDLSCAGLRIDNQLLTMLGGYRSDGLLLPFPIRIGPRRAIATAEEERRLVEKRRWGSLPFDAHPVIGATLGDLDLGRFQLEYLPAAVSPEALAENRRTRDDQLRALRLIHPDGTPTVTAILMLGTEPRRWFPGAYIQFLRLAGSNLTDPLLDQRELSGALADQLRQMDELARLNILRPAVVGGPVRAEAPEYPEEVLRQLIRNAVLHRTYEGTAAPVRVTWFEDRVEIQSPGGPYGQVTRTSCKRKPATRVHG